MADQVAVPASDIAIGGWVNESGAAVALFESLNESDAAISDIDHVRSSLNPNEDTFVCAVTAMGAPTPGPVTMKIRGLRGRLGKPVAINWDAFPSATSYVLRVGTTTGADDVFPSQNVGYVRTYTVVLAPGTYFFGVTPYIGATPQAPYVEGMETVT